MSSIYRALIHTSAMWTLPALVLAACGGDGQAGVGSVDTQVAALDDKKADSLYISDNLNGNPTTVPPVLTVSTVQRFNALTGASLDTFVPNDHGLIGTMGLIFAHNRLYVVNQNVFTAETGEVQLYDEKTGSFKGTLFSACNPTLPDCHSPLAPRGVVLGCGDVLYIGDQGNPADSGGPPNVPGRLTRFNASNGKFLGDLTPPPTSLPSTPTTLAPGEFSPRGVVFGPDGMLYTASRNNLTPMGAGPGGAIVRFDPRNPALPGEVLVHNDPDGFLNRPEGLVFGPDGRLYVASFRSSKTGPVLTDQILIYRRTTSGGLAFDDMIVLDAAPSPRAFAQALLFGPGGKLYVPISGGDSSFAGEVRVYDVATQAFTVLQTLPFPNPTYLTFGRTNPSTLVYDSVATDCGRDDNH